MRSRSLHWKKTWLLASHTQLFNKAKSLGTMQSECFNSVQLNPDMHMHGSMPQSNPPQNYSFRQSLISFLSTKLPPKDPALFPSPTNGVYIIESHFSNTHTTIAKGMCQMKRHYTQILITLKGGKASYTKIPSNPTTHWPTVHLSPPLELTLSCKHHLPGPPLKL